MMMDSMASMMILLALSPIPWIFSSSAGSIKGSWDTHDLPSLSVSLHRPIGQADLHSRDIAGSVVPNPARALSRTLSNRVYPNSRQEEQPLEIRVLHLQTIWLIGMYIDRLPISKISFLEESYLEHHKPFRPDCRNMERCLRSVAL